MLARRKPNACAECFRQRARCEFLDGAAARGAPCERCRKLGRKCTPRVALRGKESLVNRMDQGSVEDEAYRGFSLAQHNRTVAAYYNGAAAIVNSYKYLGLREAPITLQWWLNMLFFLAQRTKSLPRLHAVTCCSICIGCPIDVTLLTKRIDPPLRSHDVDVLTAQVTAEDLAVGAAYITRHIDGERSLACNQLFAELFESMGSLARRVQPHDNPSLEMWKQYLADPQGCLSTVQRFLSQIMLTGLQPRNLQGNPERLRLCVDSTDLFEIRDNQRNVYTARIRCWVTLAFGGRLAFFTFVFLNLQPTCSNGIVRLASTSHVGTEHSGQMGHPFTYHKVKDPPFSSDGNSGTTSKDHSSSPGAPPPVARSQSSASAASDFAEPCGGVAGMAPEPRPATAPRRDSFKAAAGQAVSTDPLLWEPSSAASKMSGSSAHDALAHETFLELLDELGGPGAFFDG